MKCICVSPRLFVMGMMFMLLNLVAVSAMAEEARLKPFILAETNANSDVMAVSKAVSQKLLSNGFEIVGQYSPYKETMILIISNEQLRSVASQSRMGAFGAIQRVTLTRADKGTQVSYTNPTYMAYAYQMKSDLKDIGAKLAKALGREKEYGSEKGLTKDELTSYQYKWLMPYFTDRHELAGYKNQEIALEKIEKVLATKPGGASKVYRVDLPGKEESVIGISLPGPSDNDCSGDQYIMSRIDFKQIKSSGHLPFEVVVSKGKAYALFAEFRIAINFPDLSMMGSNSFASIMCAPNSIRTALMKAVGGTEQDSSF